MIPTESALVAALAPVEIDDETGCWNWQGTVLRTGYGFVYFHKEKWLVHRLSWTLTHGPIPDRLTIDHLCRNRRCVNPEHLEPVTNRENILRGMSPMAMNARKTHCVNGHPRNEQNTYVRPDGKGTYCRPATQAERSSGVAKGDTSGDRQWVRDAFYDCDGDVLLFRFNV
mgnify:CR=1 FL=1